MPAQIVFFLVILIAAAFACGFVGATLGASIVRSQGPWQVLAVTLGPALSLAIVGAIFGLFLRVFSGRTSSNGLVLPAMLMAIGMGVGNVLSVRLRIARPTLYGGCVGAVVGAMTMVLSFTFRVNSSVLPMMALTFAPALAGFFSGLALAHREEEHFLLWDWEHGEPRPVSKDQV